MLFREAIEILGETELRRHEVEPLRAMIAFLRERWRDSDAAVYEDRLLELDPESTARIA